MSGIHRRLLASSLAILGAASTAAAAAREWTTHQGNHRHDGYVPMRIDAGGLGIRWQRQFPQVLPGYTMAVADGKVLMSRGGYLWRDGRLTALDVATGDTAWEVSLGTQDVFSPAIAGGRVFLQTSPSCCGSKFLRAFTVAGGSPLFDAPYTEQSFGHLAPTIVGGRVYVQTGFNGGLSAFDAANGAQHFFTALPQAHMWTPAVHQNRAFVYLGDSFNPWQLRVLDRLNGQVLFTIADPNHVPHFNPSRVNAAPVFGGLDDVLITQNGRLVSFDLGTRSIRYEIAGGFESGSTVTYSRAGPSVAAGVVYVVKSGSLSVRDQVTGAERWSWTAPQPLSGQMVVTASHLIARSAGTVYVLDLATRQPVWTFQGVPRTLALADETLFIRMENGDVVAVNAPRMCSSDFDGDGQIDGVDFAILLAAWGTDPGGAPDLNADGVVNQHDVAIFQADQASCQAGVPVLRKVSVGLHAVP